MKISIVRNDEERQTHEIEINLSKLTYPYAIRNTIELALELDGYSKNTINEIFGRGPQTMESPSEPGLKYTFID